MAYDYKSNDGLVESNNVEVINIWNEVDTNMKQAEYDWIAKLYSEGVKAAHPDDGWVDREQNIVTLVYPQFNAGVGIGDTIALGRPDNYRLVKLTGQPRTILQLSPKFYFEPIKQGGKEKWWKRWVHRFMK